MKRAAIASVALAACGGTMAVTAQRAATRADTYRIVHSYPHDPRAFTQGLVYLDGFLYESTGLTGRSSVRKVRLESGEVLQKYDVDARYFAEGLAAWGDTLIQLTWQTGLGFVYDRASFRQVRTFTYAGEGWGFTQDGKRLILSDGSPEGGLRFFDPVTFKETSRVVVRDRGMPVRYLNELEFIKGEVWANIWQTDRIARINPSSGEVTGWIDLAGLLQAADLDSGAVLNGIAYDAAQDRVFVTGKLWPRLFEIKVEPSRRAQGQRPR